ncbi:sigma-54 dependent transcriptional regulator [Massilia eurypsychrophila]|uniref:sigma-54 dependent transcriptional regulator n=1 Tax=Massilia eurypsychrophila TaxID=1485217 RepID=UPI001E2D9EA1|nr:sigma-54 dependent transcriptional regulator [Massilia eurypsychrophila]
MSKWDICIASSIQEADQILQTQQYKVGLLLDFIGIESSAEAYRFFNRHSNIRWIGLLDRKILDCPETRALVADNLSDFQTLPLDRARLNYTIGHAFGFVLLRERVADVEQIGVVDAILGNSIAIISLRSQIRKIARTNAPVLIWGESGSGKELVAHAIHMNSSRAGGPFVPVNCGAFAASLIQSELFGYESGSFTGAAKGKAGLLESAAGGTLFLDEIGDLPLDSQTNFLRFLQERTITRIGATREISVDARVIAASHVNLKDAVARGQFREDLYYRLNVLPIEVPSLRARRVDVSLLSEHFFKFYNFEKGAHVKGFSRKALMALERYDWPGNVRELINCVRRAMVLADGAMIMPSDLNLADPSTLFNGDALGESRMSAERDAICLSLAIAKKNVTHAARDLGVSRMSLYRLIAKHNITV